MGSNTIISMENKTFGKWKVLDFSHKHPISGNAYWKCICACGTKTIVEGSRLRKGKTQQCKACHGRDQLRHIKYKQNRANDLYVVKCGNYFKIGVTDNIEVRLKSLQSCNPYPITLELFYKGKGMYEEALHKAFHKYHHSGEWFNIGGSCEIN
jgi:hypothetical protein